MPQICKATEYNWKRLNHDTSSRLTSRANKTASRRRIVASGYLNIAGAAALVDALGLLDDSLHDIMFTLCREALRQAGLIDKPHVVDFLNSQSGSVVPSIPYVPQGLLSSDGDVLGFIYQSLVEEGIRIQSGIYYTNAGIVDYVVSRLPIAPGHTVLDPCCGSGAFLLRCNVSDPRCLYGFDIDPTAVMIASTNLMLKFRNSEFTPNIFCRDFLDLGQPDSACKTADFDFVLTNPPWGADKVGRYKGQFQQIKSRERASMIMLGSLARLSDNAMACFILPRSILSTDAHADIRGSLLMNCEIRQIDLFSERFDGVFTNFFALTVRKHAPADGTQTYSVSDGDKTMSIKLGTENIAGCEISVTPPSDIRQSILDKMDAAGRFTLAQSRFALGIVTGDNKRMLCDAPGPELEPIFTGKNVAPFALLPPNRFIHFDRNRFQQCAPAECYRAPEKLVYKFIASHPVVAYDNTGSLTLNSANIVIPSIVGYSARSVCAMLNSAPYRFYYTCRFADIKVLKKNLCALPFPELPPGMDSRLAALAYQGKPEMIDGELFRLFNLSPDEIAHITKQSRF